MLRRLRRFLVRLLSDTETVTVTIRLCEEPEIGRQINDALAAYYRDIKPPPPN